MKRAPLESGEELQLIKAYTLVPVLLDVLERDIGTLRTLQLKMPELYIQSLRLAQDKINAELPLLRRQLQQSGIRVYEMKRTPDGLESRYLCRGYQRLFTMLWSLVRAEVEMKLAVYLGL